jgi:hypothetical protein
MQITKELLDQEITNMEARHEQAKAQANQLAGAVVVLKDLRNYLDREEPKAEDKTEISAENKAIQDREEARSLAEVAEDVAGPGAVAEEPEPIKTKWKKA